MAPKRKFCEAEAKDEAKKEEKKMWGGRFTGKVDPVMEAFNSSIGEDRILWKVDLEGSRGYSHALERAKVLTKEEGKAIRTGLEKVGKEWALGTFDIKPDDEDIHMANERRLTEIVGPPGAKIHTARSRNDQVATDVRLWLREEGAEQLKLLADFLATSAERARAEVETLMPGYTHMQRAQPIRWSHWIMAHASSVRRDSERLKECLGRVNHMPLGSGALAGNPFAIDRRALAKVQLICIRSRYKGALASSSSSFCDNTSIAKNVTS
ncbi:L-Aspartase-like protein [Pavlovales sp. CCMP2436]|nr:L-Aspartase-like protein [Pavlovales sp. CCMP2436]